MLGRARGGGRHPWPSEGRLPVAHRSSSPPPAQWAACASSWLPLSELNLPPACVPSSYDIELMERLSGRMGWAPDRLNWTCIDW